MSRLAKIARRTFLIGSAAIAGGVAFGVYQHRRVLPNPLQPGEGQVTLNPWIVIDGDGVGLIAPRAEMGQGVHTTLPALIAEELDVAWDSIRVLHGPAAQAYYNAALNHYALPVSDYDLRPWEETLLDASEFAPKMLSLQVTGGSSSARDAFVRLRQAGAVAREVLKQAAAERLGLPIDVLGTEDGQVIAPAGITLSYADLAEAAAQIDPPREVPLRPPSDWKYLRRAMPRTDMVAKSTGTAVFASDIRLPGMAFATVRMTPRLAGEMRGFNASTAEAMPGVRRVIDLGTGIAVVADTTWTAMQAAEAVEIDWGPAPYPDSTDQMMAAIRQSLDGPRNSKLRDDGDIDGMEIAPEDRVIEAEYSVPFLAHATMEPMSAAAHYTEGTLRIWAGHQAPGLAEQAVVAATGLDRDRVSLEVTLLGGGFGRRAETDFVVQAARIAVEMEGTPIQLMWSREEDMRHDVYRPAAAARLRGVIRGGFAQGLDARVAAPSVFQDLVSRFIGLRPPIPDKIHVEGIANQPYAIPNFRVTGHLTDLDVPVGIWRSVGNSQNAFFLESFIDEMALAARRDPLAFRLDMARRAYAPAAAVLEAVAGMSGWTGETPGGIGRGVAMCLSFGTPVAIVIEVSDRKGVISVDRAWMACDMGTALDPGIVEAQMTSGLLFGLSAAVMQEITFADGEVEQWNFPDFDALRIHQAPRIQVQILETQSGLGGAGEPGVPPAAPALANALFDLTGERVRDLPLNRTFDFVW